MSERLPNQGTPDEITQTESRLSHSERVDSRMREQAFKDAGVETKKDFNLSFDQDSGTFSGKLKGDSVRIKIDDVGNILSWIENDEKKSNPRYLITRQKMYRGLFLQIIKEQNEAEQRAQDRQV